MYSATVGGLSLEGIDVTKETVIQGIVSRDGQPVGGAYVRLLDGSGEFTAEVPTSATGQFRFFAAPGSWTLRTLAPGSTLDRQVVASQGQTVDVSVELPPGTLRFRRSPPCCPFGCQSAPKRATRWGSTFARTARGQ